MKKADINPDHPLSYILGSMITLFNQTSPFFFKDTAPTEIYTRKDTLSLHDALPISWLGACAGSYCRAERGRTFSWEPMRDRKSTRLNSSHPSLSRMPSSA